MELELTGKLALVTGASKGIGRAAAMSLAAEGCNLVLAARSKPDLEAVREEIAKRYNVRVDVDPTDLSIGDNARALAERHPDVDVLVNNAGAIPTGTLQDVDEARWRAGWDLKVFGYINLTRAYYPIMAKRRSGVIVNVIGLAGERPSAGYIAGSMGNASLMAFTKALGGESLRDGIRVVGINPGFIQTERMQMMLRHAAKAKFGDPERWDELSPKDPPPGATEEVADLVAFLASARASHITGTVIAIDGGSSGR